MNAGGWTIMLLSVGFVTGLFAWCIAKVLSTPGDAHGLHSSNDPTPDAQRRD